MTTNNNAMIGYDDTFIMNTHDNSQSVKADSLILYVSSNKEL